MLSEHREIMEVWVSGTSQRRKKDDVVSAIADEQETSKKAIVELLKASGYWEVKRLREVNFELSNMDVDYEAMAQVRDTPSHSSHIATSRTPAVNSESIGSTIRQTDDDRDMLCEYCKDELRWGATVCKSCGAKITYVNLGVKEANREASGALWISAFFGLIAGVVAAIIGLVLTGQLLEPVFWLFTITTWIIGFVILMRPSSGLRNLSDGLAEAKFSKPKRGFVGMTIGGE